MCLTSSLAREADTTEWPHPPAGPLNVHVAMTAVRVTRQRPTQQRPRPPRGPLLRCRASTSASVGEAAPRPAQPSLTTLAQGRDRPASTRGTRPIPTRRARPLTGKLQSTVTRQTGTHRGTGESSHRRGPRGDPLTRSQTTTPSPDTTKRPSPSWRRARAADAVRGMGRWGQTARSPRAAPNSAWNSGICRPTTVASSPSE